MRAFPVRGKVGGSLRNQRLGDPTGQKTRGLGLQFDQLVDRGLGGDLLLERLESGVVHGGPPVQFGTYENVMRTAMANGRESPDFQAIRLESTFKSNCAMVND